MKHIILLFALFFSSQAIADYVIESQEFRAAKSGSTEYIYVGSSNINYIGIINTANTTDVLDVEVVTNRGSYDLYELRGRFDEYYGPRSRSARIYSGDYIEYIVVRAHSPNIFGSRGRYVVQAVVDTYSRYDHFRYRRYWRAPRYHRPYRPIYRPDRHPRYRHPQYREQPRYRRDVPRRRPPVERPRNRRDDVRPNRPRRNPPPVRRSPDRRSPRVAPTPRPGREHNRRGNSRDRRGTDLPRNR